MQNINRNIAFNLVLKALGQIEMSPVALLEHCKNEYGMSTEQFIDIVTELEHTGLILKKSINLSSGEIVSYRYEICPKSRKERSGDAQNIQ